MGTFTRTNTCKSICVDILQYIFNRTNSFTSEFRSCYVCKNTQHAPPIQAAYRTNTELQKEKSFIAFQGLVPKIEEFKDQIHIYSWRQSRHMEFWHPEPQNTPLIKGTLFHTHGFHKKGHIQNRQFQPTSQPSLIPYTLTGCSWN